MGARGYFGSQRLAFLVAASLTVPALIAVRSIGPDRARVGQTGEAPESVFSAFRLPRDDRLFVYASCVALIQVASIAVPQLAEVDVTARPGARGPLVTAAFIIVPRVVVAAFSPWIGPAAAGDRPETG